MHIKLYPFLIWKLFRQFLGGRWKRRGRPGESFPRLYFLQTDLVSPPYQPLPSDGYIQQDSSEIWFHRADKMLQGFRYQEAKRCFDRALEINPRDGIALAGKGYCLYKLGDIETALGYYKKACSINPRDGILLNNMGICYCHLQLYQEALECLEKAQDLGYVSEALLNSKGYCLARLNRYDEACSAFKAALEKSEKANMELLGNLAAALLKSGKQKDAMYYFDLALQQAPDEPVLLNNVAVYLAEQGRLDLALKCYNQALFREPENLTFLCNKGACLVQAGDYERAYACLEDVIKRARENSLAWGSLAVLHLRKGNPEEALYCFNRSLGLV